ncbi:type II secretion system protein D precursor [mine drainage metagenome]|uniref:Type II secretion system protein D n=1 Tax=mine drainage metagenome TaxID=410659 RepID=A0A1J5S4Y6_9ZZZZ
MVARRLRTGFLRIALLALLGLSAPLAQSAQAATKAPDEVTLNFVNADIDGVVKAVSEMTGKNFVLDPRVKGTINIVSAKPVSKALAYEVFLSALRLQGYAAVEDGGIVKILPEGDAKLHQSPTLGPLDKARGDSDRIQTQVFALKYQSAAQMVPILRPLIAPNNTITASQNGNTLVITDYASNLQRLEKIIDAIDQPSGSEPIIIPLKYASALDVAQTVNRLFAETGQTPGAAADPSQRLIVIADARSNSLLARSIGDPTRLARLRQFVALLDTPTSAAGNIHVIYLKNADAVKLSETLRAIYQGDTTAAPHSAMTPPTPLGANATAAPSTLGASSSLPRTTQSAATAPGIIQADAATNSLIITAPDAIYNNLRAVVDKLDKRRAQVYVEALIAEVTSDKAAEFGIQWQNLSGIGKDKATAFGGTNFGSAAAGQNILGIAQNPTTAGAGLNIGVLNGSVSIGGANVLNLGLLVRALENDANANILSTPTLLTLDNDEAKIVVGQNVPFITGQYAVSGAATTPTPFQTVERKDVGLTLKIKPQISEGGTVKLQIYQEVSSIADTSNAAGVITNLRSVESTVLVDNGQIVVLGGLMQDSLSDGVGKVPLLGDLPVIGNLFKYNTRNRSKTNLMVFLRPIIVRDAEHADALSRSSYDAMLGVQSEAAAKARSMPLLQQGGSPSLPPQPIATPTTGTQ